MSDKRSHLVREAHEVKECILEESDKAEIYMEVISRGQRGAIVGALNEALGGDSQRYLVLAWLFNKDTLSKQMSSKDLSDGQWVALWRWVDFHSMEGAWEPHPAFETEALRVLTEAIRDLPDTHVLKGTLTDNLIELGGVITKATKPKIFLDLEAPEPPPDF